MLLFSAAIFAICAVVAQEYSCDDFCFCSFDTAQCVNIKFFPRFESTNWIKTLIISDSSLHFIPQFRSNEFKALTELTFINCPNIDCQDIAAVDQPGLIINIEFDCNINSNLTIITTTTERDFSNTVYFINNVTNSENEQPLIYPSNDHGMKNRNTFIISSASAAALLVVFGTVVFIVIRKLKRSQVAHSTAYDEISMTTQATAV